VKRGMLAMSNLGTVSQSRGEWDDARETYAELEKIADRVGNEALYSTVATNQAAIELSTGTLEAARTLQQRALEVATEAGQQDKQIHAILNRGRIALLSGDLEAATTDATDGTDLARANDFRHLEVGGCMLHGRIARERGDLEEAVDTHREARAVAVSLGSDWHLALTETSLGWSLLQTGAVEAALEVVGSATDRLAEGYHVDHLNLTVARGAAHRIRAAEASDAYRSGSESDPTTVEEDRQRARTAFERVLEAGSKARTETVLRCHRELGHLERDEGEIEAARRQYRKGLERANTSGMGLYQRQFETTLDTLEAAVEES